MQWIVVCLIATIHFTLPVSLGTTFVMVTKEVTKETKFLGDIPFFFYWLFTIFRTSPDWMVFGARYASFSIFYRLTWHADVYHLDWFHFQDCQCARCLSGAYSYRFWIWSWFLVCFIAQFREWVEMHGYLGENPCRIRIRILEDPAQDPRGS